MSANRPARASEENEDLGALLEYLKRNRGFDFSGYKRASLERRIRKRMDTVEVDSYSDYQDLLEVQPGEFTDLFNTILINVTAFFRDPPAWEFLAGDVIPKLIADRPEDQPIRVWCAACSSGEEAYTTAIVLAEALGADQFRKRVKIYATDVDEEALTIARHASYSRDSVKSVPDELRDKYFEQSPMGYVFRADLRRSVIFGRNDLVQDAPISRVDLLVSRNTLMYFTPETQTLILRRFNFSLNDSGFLFLGKSEMLITHTELFTPYDLRWRVFKRVSQPGMRERYAFVTGAGFATEEEAREPLARLLDAGADVLPLAQVLVDRNGVVAAANQAARTLFQLGATDVGRPLQDLELSYRPVDLRSALDQAWQTERPVKLGRVGWRTSADELVTLDAAVTPLLTPAARPLGASITFADVTAHAELDRQHAESKRRLETAHEELQSTVEELETTNEELQSTNEELETTNEELQSTNEELETMNAELQSTNDELEVVNDEQRERSAELDRLNLFLEGILGNLGLAVVVVDREVHVQLWNGSAQEIWGLQPGEVLGRPLLSLDTGLPVDALRDPLDRALAAEPEDSELAVEAVNRRGRAFECAIRTLPLRTPAGDTYGAIVLMSDAGSPS
ncbi:MAG: CheR family methyltransferase [Thermoleophilaceae bacterium]